MLELDGRPVEVNDLATLALCNYGHFTSMRVEDGGVRGLSLHLERLSRDCRVLFDADLDTALVRHLVRRARDIRPVTARVTVFAPGMDLGQPGLRLEPHVLVSTRPACAGELPPLRLRSIRYERELPAVKHVGLLGTVLHRRTAQLAGCDDVLFVSQRGHVSEGATWNIGFVDNGRVTWPSADFLLGTTLQLLRTEAGHLTAPLDLPTAYGMRAAFVTNATIGVRPIARIDNAEYQVDDEAIATLRATYQRIPIEEL